MAADSMRRAREIVASLPLDERLALISGRDMWRTHAVPASGVPSVMMADGPHGLRRESGPSDGVSFEPGEPATCFPTAAALACSWDPELVGEVGRAIGEEAAAAGVGVVLGPGMNVKRHPCCGRNFEYYSEDPLLSGRMAAGFVAGVQSVGVGACVKHYAANNQESGRMVTDVVVDERTLRELYLAGFEIAVAESEPWAVMCAYNRVNGEYCSDSRVLLTGVLRDEWGFEGLVMSDWGAVNDRVAGVAAGLDLEMPGSAGAHDGEVRAALADDRLQEADLNESAARVVALALRAEGTSGAIGAIGVADVPEAAVMTRELGASPLAEGQAEPLTDRHHELARRAAAESTVLLANDGVLPLGAGSRIAVIGAMAAEPRYQGTGSSRVTPTRVENALAAIRSRARTPDEVTYVAAYEPATGDLATTGLADATAAASAADVALVFVGLPPAYESEGFDRPHMRLPEGHDRLVEAVVAVNPRTVVTIAGGAPVELPWADRAAAIVATYLGGQAGGVAVADVLFGDAEPGGRLAETWPLLLADVPADPNFPGESRQVQYREGLYVGYRYFSTAGRPVRYCFGHGLSYTTFALGDVRLGDTHIGAGAGVDVRVSVTNTGQRGGADVVQVYVRKVTPLAQRPDRVLAGFAKLWLEPGESAEAAVTLGPRAFAHFDVASGAWRTEAGEYEILVGASAEETRRRATLVVESDFTPETDVQTAPPGYVADDERFAQMLGRPVPEPEPPLPYRRTSTVADLGQTALGRMLRRILLRAAERRIAAAPGVDPATVAMVRAVVLEMPLRSLATMSGGTMSLKALDALIAALNSRWGAAMRELVGLRGGRSAR